MEIWENSPAFSGRVHPSYSIQVTGLIALIAFCNVVYCGTVSDASRLAALLVGYMVC
jgi:hypothetical protein